MEKDRFKELLENGDVVAVFVFLLFAILGAAPSLLSPVSKAFDWDVFLTSIEVGAWIITAFVLLIGFTKIIRASIDAVKERRNKKL